MITPTLINKKIVILIRFTYFLFIMVGISIRVRVADIRVLR